jgi:hypothetical protein
VPASKPYDPTPSPRPTLQPGQQVALTHDRFAYGQTSSEFGTVIGYATPDLKTRQAWTAESYYVRFDRDRPGARRVFDRAHG